MSKPQARSASIYVGADNDTGTLELDRIRNVLDKRHTDGYTIFQAQGCWHGHSEPCAVCVITGTTRQITGTAARLQAECRQEAVGVQFTNPIQFVRGTS